MLAFAGESLRGVIRFRLGGRAGPLLRCRGPARFFVPGVEVRMFPPEFAADDAGACRYGSVAEVAAASEPLPRIPCSRL